MKINWKPGLVLNLMATHMCSCAPLNPPSPMAAGAVEINQPSTKARGSCLSASAISPWAARSVCPHSPFPECGLLQASSGNWIQSMYPRIDCWRYKMSTNMWITYTRYLPPLLSDVYYNISCALSR